MKHSKLTRRDFMQMLSSATVGGLLAPQLPVMNALANTGGAPTRLLFIAKGHGWFSNKKYNHTPQSGGTSTADYFYADPSSPMGIKLPPSHTPLYEIGEHVIFIDGVRGGFWGNAHDVSYTDILTSAVPANENSSTINSHFPRPVGPSIDWFLGQRLNKDVLRVSAGYRGWGEKHNPLSFNDKFDSLPYLTTNKEVYEAVAGPILKAQDNTPESVLKRMINQELFRISGKSVDNLAKLVKSNEKNKLDSFKSTLEGVNPENTSTDFNSSLSVPAAPPSTFPLYQNLVENSFDLIKLAFRADTHRVAVLGVSGQLEQWAWTDKDGSTKNNNPWPADGFHHAIAHYNDAGHPGSIEALDGCNKWYIQQVVNFAKQLNTIIDVDGHTLLENTMIVLTGEVGNGQHDRANKPIIIIGGRGSAQLKTGRLITTEKVNPRDRKGFFIGREDKEGKTITNGVNYGSWQAKQTEADLLVGIARAMGQNINQFGLPLTNTIPFDFRST